MGLKLGHLLFLDDLSHLMEKSHLHMVVPLLSFPKEDYLSLVVASVHSLNKTAAFQNFVIVPLNLEHPPNLLDVNCSQTFLIPPLFSLTSEKLV